MSQYLVVGKYNNYINFQLHKKQGLSTDPSPPEKKQLKYKLKKV